MALRCRMCSDCLRHLRIIGEKEKVIRRRADRIRSLEKRLEKMGRSPGEKPFGLSTPSSKILLKPTAAKKNRDRKGGRPKGHKGQTRRNCGSGAADRVEKASLDKNACPKCGVELPGSAEKRTREYLDLERQRLERIHCELETCRCPNCRTRVTATPEGVLPGQYFSNSLLARMAVAHYLDNHTFGFLERHLGIGKSAIIQSLQRLARMLGPMHPAILEQVRQAAVVFADETTWRSDGANGYAWAVFSEHAEAFLFRLSRAGSVATELFGTDPLPGAALTDRYAGYNHIPIRRQFCYAHLKRDLEKVLIDSPDSTEAKKFVAALMPSLAEAMGLRTESISDTKYYRRAKELRERIMKICRRPARLSGVQHFQNIFRNQSHHLFLWVEDRNIPVENNRAERGVRPIVIARKLSHGTQSGKGMETMEVLLTVLRTLQLRTGNAEEALVGILNAVARDPTVDVKTLIPPVPASQSHCVPVAA